jgi:hypothetical protein
VSVRHRQFGDFQTPVPLARAVCAKLKAITPRTIVEPTCGIGHFLKAAAETFPAADRIGFELHGPYVEAARETGAVIHHADFFAVDWEAEAATWREPILVVGNPPWVTNAEQTRVSGQNLPPKHNTEGRVGIAALTGQSNFDLAQAMFERLLQVLEGRDAVIALLCKTSVARRLVGRLGQPVGLWRIDAVRHFGASVDAGLFVLRAGGSPGPCPVFDALDAERPSRRMSYGVADVDAWERSKHLAGRVDRWRSGVKHDAASVLQLTSAGEGWINGVGETVDVEKEVLFPLLKSSDLAHGRSPTRCLLLPQRRLGEDTALLAHSAPKAWAYLCRHGSRLDARRSRIYKGRPRFSVFGVGPYCFEPYKVAISGMYRSLKFRVIGPHEGRPVLFDDTCYQLSFATESEALAAWGVLTSDAATDFFRSRVWWDAKRPITKALLASFGGVS